MAADNLVGVNSFDETVRRIMAVSCEPASSHSESDISAAPTELKIRRCLDELLCCYELRTQELLCEERSHHKRSQRCQESKQRRADLTHKIAADTATAEKASAAERDAVMQLRVKQTEQELAEREQDLEKRRQDMDALSLRLEAREDAVSTREHAAHVRELDLDNRERNVAVHELMIEEQQRLVAEEHRALELDQQRHAEQQASRAGVERQLGKSAEAVASREQSVPSLKDAQRLSEPSAPPRVGSMLAAWEGRLAPRERAPAESRRERETQERTPHDRERRFGNADGPAAPAATRCAPHDSHCLSSAAAGQPSPKMARKRDHDNGISGTASVLKSQPAAPGRSILAGADADLGARDAGPSSKRHVAEPHLVTSAFARFTGPITRLLVGGEGPASLD